jgi:hypothetical protein
MALQESQPLPTGPGFQNLKESEVLLTFRGPKRSPGRPRKKPRNPHLLKFAPTAVRESAGFVTIREVSRLLRTSNLKTQRYCRKLGILIGQRLFPELGEKHSCIPLCDVERLYRHVRDESLAKERTARIRSLQSRGVDLQPPDCSIEIAAKCFEWFESGKSPVSIVLEKIASPRDVARAFDWWSRLKGSAVLAAEVMRALNTLPWKNGGAILSGEDLITAIHDEFAWQLEDRACAACGVGDRFLCSACVQKNIDRVRYSFLGPDHAPLIPPTVTPKVPKAPGARLPSVFTKPDLPAEKKAASPATPNAPPDSLLEEDDKPSPVGSAGS